MISVRGVSKIYGGKVPTVALRDVSFEIADAEFVAIMGRSGSGKSTLLHLLGLLDMPTRGSIVIDRVDVVRLSDGQRTRFRLSALGYVFQEYALVAELTAIENVYLPAFARGWSARAYQARAAELLDVVGLGNRLKHYPHELSGGKQQRVAIARALVNEPRVLFADEPTANLDTASSAAVLELFRKVNKERGQTILMVTHEPDDERYVDRVIWLKDGELEQIRTVSGA